MAGLVAKNYCEAIFSIAVEDHKLDLYKEQLNFVDETMSDANFYTILSHPKISRTEKKDILEKVYAKDIDATLLNFLKLLIDKGHFRSLHEIVKEYKKSYNEVNNIQVVYVRSAQGLKEDEIQRLTKALESKLHKQIDLRLSVDEDLIAGIRVKINDQIMDNSASARLQRMRKSVSLTKI